MPAHKSKAQQLFFSATFSLALALSPLSPLSLVTPVMADMTITAIPPRVDLKADPGQTITTEVKVRNGSNFTQNFGIEVSDFIVVDKIGTPLPVNGKINPRWSLKSWISAPDSVPVDANSIQVVKVTLKVPRTALTGGHYAMITFTPNAEFKSGDLKKTGNLISQRVGTLIYLTVNGAITEKAEVTSFTTEKFNEQGPIIFNGNITNLSDVHVNPTGTISIYSPINSKVAELPVETGNIFPEATRDFTQTWSEKWGYGRYRADLKLAYGATGAILATSIFFWLFPIRLVIYSLLAFISVLLAIILINRRNRHHQQELEKEVNQLKKELEELEKHETSK